MAQAHVSFPQRPFGQTSRRDAWWAYPLFVFLGLTAFIVYATWAALQGANYYWGPYLSPFYAPEIYGESPHAWLGPKPDWWPGWLLFSPAMLILWAPGGFRFTCYYYRGAYYKAFWADPPSCAVGEPRKSYWGERRFPLIIQNFHRYFLYLAIIFLFLLGYDAWKAMWFTDAAGNVSFGIGVGTIALTANVVLLAGYTLGCHSMRHLAGGRLDRISEKPACEFAYRCSSGLNRKHMLWAWMSLFSVAFSDLYVRMLAMGVWTDWRIV
jgi:hypothetical protein